MNICVRFLAFEGLTQLSARGFLEYIFCCFKERPAGQFVIKKSSVSLATGFFPWFVSNYRVTYFRIRSRQLVSLTNSALFRFIWWLVHRPECKIIVECIFFPFSVGIIFSWLLGFFPLRWNT